MKLLLAKLIPPLLCAAVILSGCESRTEPSDRIPSQVPSTESAQSEPMPSAAPPAVSSLETTGPDEGRNSMEDVTAHVSFAPHNELIVTRPYEDIQLDAAYYYITGISDADLPLLLNGEEVEHRGEMGSFGVYAELEDGENTFTFTQGEQSVTVTITRKQDDGESYSLTDIATRMRPEWDAVARAGEEYLLSCVAPSGATVTATIGDTKIALEQRAATAVEGVPATFLGSLTPEDLSGTAKLGAVVYTLEWDGETTEYPSQGELYVVGKDSPLLVEAVNVSATVFAEESDDGAFYSLLSQGAIDEVTTIGESMYELAMGGWVVKDAVAPLTDVDNCQNQVQQATHTAEDARDTLVLAGTSPAPYRAQWGDGIYQITLFHTTGVEEISIAQSDLLEEVAVAQADGDTTLTFRPKESVEMGGYLVAYDGNNTVITVKPRLRLTQGAYPLLGVTVALDPGHGGSDAGAAGVARDEGPQESAINLETAIAVRQYLRGLGATVVMTREGDTRVEMNERQEILRHPAVDIAVSLHANSIDSYLDGTGPSGTETYYYDPASQKLAEAINNAVCEETGRTNRGDKHLNYMITLNSYSPTVMVEMGFLTNPVEYDEMCSKQGIYDVACGVGDGILTALQ